MKNGADVIPKNRSVLRDVIGILVKREIFNIEAHMETWQHFDGYFKSDDDYRNIRNDIKKAKDFLALRRQEHESTD